MAEANELWGRGVSDATEGNMTGEEGAREAGRKGCMRKERQV